MKLAKLIPWHEFEELYARTLAGTGMGAPAMSVGVALGSLIIKERLGKDVLVGVNEIITARAMAAPQKEKAPAKKDDTDPPYGCFLRACGYCLSHRREDPQ